MKKKSSKNRYFSKSEYYNQFLFKYIYVYRCVCIYIAGVCIIYRHKKRETERTKLLFPLKLFYLDLKTHFREIFKCHEN